MRTECRAGGRNQVRLTRRHINHGRRSSHGPARRALSDAALPAYGLPRFPLLTNAGGRRISAAGFGLEIVPFRSTRFARGRPMVRSLAVSLQNSLLSLLLLP